MKERYVVIALHLSLSSTIPSLIFTYLLHSVLPLLPLPSFPHVLLYPNSFFPLASDVWSKYPHISMQDRNNRFMPVPDSVLSSAAMNVSQSATVDPMVRRLWVLRPPLPLLPLPLFPLLLPLLLPPLLPLPSPPPQLLLLYLHFLLLPLLLFFFFCSIHNWVSQ